MKDLTTLVTDNIKIGMEGIDPDKREEIVAQRIKAVQELAKKYGLEGNPSFVKNFLAKKMDARVKPGHDGSKTTAPTP